MRVVVDSTGSHLCAHEDTPRRDDEQWVGLLRWLEKEHGMDVGRSRLLVERREAKGTARSLSCSRPLLIFSSS